MGFHLQAKRTVFQSIRNLDKESFYKLSNHATLESCKRIPFSVVVNQ